MTDTTNLIESARAAVYDHLLAELNHSPTSGKALNANYVLNKRMDDVCVKIKPITALRVMYEAVAAFAEEAFCVMVWNGYEAYCSTEDLTLADAKEWVATHNAGCRNCELEIVVF